MIYGLLHPGSGVGNQLFRYITVRTLALDKGYDFEMIGRSKLGFLGIFENTTIPYTLDTGGKVVAAQLPLWEEKTIYYNPEINFIEDGTVIDGEFQDERYWKHRLKEINEWLKVEPLETEKCIINFRGGEFSLFPDLFLPWSYWEKAIRIMRTRYPGIDFEVHTDDPILARQFFPGFDVVDNQTLGHSLTTNMDFNWRTIRYAKHLILSNSSFAILPALLNENVKEVIAPRGWGSHNKQRWDFPQNYYPKFTYI